MKNKRAGKGAINRDPTRGHDKSAPYGSPRQTALWVPRSPIARIAIFRALYVGDLLLAVPALRSIRAGFPDAEITLIGLPWAKSFVRRFHHYIDRFVEFVGYPGLSEVEVIPERTALFLEEQRTYGYDLVIQMHGNGSASDFFALALGGQATIGYYEETPPAGLTISAPYPEDSPEVFRNLGLAALLGCPNQDPRLEFPLFAGERAEAAALLTLSPGEGCPPCIGIHPGSHSPARRWPAEYFARVADVLAQRFGAQIILTGGPGEEATVQAVIERMKTRAIIAAGKTSLGGLAALIDEMDLFISNDTGPAHIADALDTLSITIFGPTDPRRWAPLDQVRHPIVRKEVLRGVYPERSEWPQDDKRDDGRDQGGRDKSGRNVRWVTPEVVIEVAERLLSQRFNEVELLT